MNQVTTPHRIVVTVDGLAGSGKTTLSKKLAERLGFAHLNSGILYRGVGWLCLQHNVSTDDTEGLSGLLQQHSLKLSLDEKGRTQLSIDGTPCGSELYTPEVSEATSRSSKQQVVREALLDTQREAFDGSSLVAEGRDMGTVVFPDAHVKFFVEVSVETRVARRLDQMYGDLTLLSEEKRAAAEQEMQREIIERDHRDSTRDLSPTVAAQGSVIIHNDGLELTQVIQKMYDCVASKT